MSVMNLTEDQKSLYALPQGNKSGIFTFCRPTSEVNVLIAVHSVLIFVIVAINSIIICTFAKNRKIRTVTNYFFASLAVSDTLVGCVSIPMWIYMFVFPLHNNCSLPGVRFMEVYRFMDIFSALSSTAHLMAISCERSLAITRPLWHRACSKNFFYALLVIAWLYGLITSGLIVADFSKFWIRYRAIAVFVAGFCVPLITIIILYAMTYKSVKSYVQRRRSNSAGNLQKYIHREKRTAVTVAFVLVAFILAWLPFFVVSLVATFCMTCGKAIFGFTPVINFVKVLHYCNSAINPFIYTFRNATWKRAFLRVVLPCMKIPDEKLIRAQWQSTVRGSGITKKSLSGTTFERKSRNQSSDVRNENYKCRISLFSLKPK
ncbi:dopamine receptor 2-like isoform X1 [Actinia tenebrosa]|uniref:Dopamine receptor 2-like isoform X1 n=1 Tax=Actinia tenebrosa TaxID=6105 RepID=A0A6P8I8F4_ACTTE|nr:dopamine receptor 2-like isoform X1 [Actinia tenebrosa]XP_031564838.1 dopamine receptor 2-like isoform X1 [Actinia tenebrosa]XP_031564839.1 dopamine receptor 2-like isoform X1 [Actinia tenebrosa]XP_031564841.1 dopamine receptor 2-like isoform X1 [Actinia tenebrosa]XP_031564842.1 dopamine receptor 2-like isoform X1 [Actinia tenebrosa]XP_031564843.1 dopamine receptor 2-like isoform X1 [Actinia tenebrosa]